MSWYRPSGITATQTPREPGELVFASDLPAGASLFECLWLAWEEARSEGHCAYHEWQRAGGVDAYIVYRAAQDRADAAQDALAQAARRAL